MCERSQFELQLFADNKQRPVEVYWYMPSLQDFQCMLKSQEDIQHKQENIGVHFKAIWNMLTAVASITGVPLDTSNKPEVVIPTHKQSEDDDSLPTKGTYDDYRDVNKIDEKPVHDSAITDHSTRMSVQLLIIARAITDHSTQFMHMYDRVPHELLEDVSAITDHSTRQACPSRTFDRHPTSSCRQSKTAHTVPVH